MPVAIDKPSSYFNTKLYTGNGGSSQSITGVGFQPDFVWIKDRPLGFDHNLFDSVRGIYKALFSNTTYVENFGQGSNTDSLTSFDADGFSVGGDDALNDPYTYVSWNWKANGAGVSNTVGTITSTVSANTTSGFSIVSYTGNGTGGATIGHGLGVTPKMFIIKQRTDANAWVIYHASVDVTGDYTLRFDTGAKTNGNDTNNDTAPTSSLITLGASSLTNQNTSTYIAYCFADVKGYSKFGSYTGNGSADGTYVHLGFTPAFVMTRRTDSAENWAMFDNKRDGFNVNNRIILANTSDAENTTNTYLDLLSNGFKARSTSGAVNSSGGNYIYMAFASSPFTSSKGICATAK
jgi:hypothetical protein